MGQLCVGKREIEDILRVPERPWKMSQTMASRDQKGQKWGAEPQIIDRDINFSHQRIRNAILV